jgi:hypothetical protein
MEETKIIEIEVGVKGLPPGLLTNPMTLEKLKEIYTKVYGPADTKWDPEKTAKGRIPIDSESGKMGIPAQYFYSCFIEAGRDQKNGTKNISTVTSSTLPSFLWIKEDFLPFKNGDGSGDIPWAADIRRGNLKQKSEKIAVCLIRPKFREWEVEFTLTLDTVICNAETVRKLIEKAGNKVGVGSFRPACRGPFGRFIITKWKPQNGTGENEAEE